MGFIKGKFFIEHLEIIKGKAYESYKRNAVFLLNIWWARVFLKYHNSSITPLTVTTCITNSMTNSMINAIIVRVRLERWPNFCGDAMAMVFFSKWCNTDVFGHTLPSLLMRLFGLFRCCSIFHNFWLVSMFFFFFFSWLLVCFFMVCRDIFMVFHF